jgi:hypothetical protein
MKSKNEVINKLGEDYNNSEMNLRTSVPTDNYSNNCYYGDGTSYFDKLFSAANDSFTNNDNLVMFKRPVTSSFMFTSPYYDVNILECVLNAYANSDIDGTIECLKSIKNNMYKTCRDIIKPDKSKKQYSPYSTIHPNVVWTFDTYIDIRKQAELLCDAFWMSGAWYSEYLNNPVVFSCALYMLAEDLIGWFENYKANNTTTTTRRSNKSTKDKDQV